MIPLELVAAADFARCMGHTTTPAMEADVLDAPAPSTLTAAPEVSPEVQAVLDARAAVVVANSLFRSANEAFTAKPNFTTMDAAKAAERAYGDAVRLLRKAELVTYVPGATPDEDRRAFWNRHQGLRNEIDSAEFALQTATKKGQKKAMERHAATIARLKADLAAFDAAHKHWSDPD